ncbi:MAG: 6-phosphofructokinase [Planctomycetota bacterium]
MSAQKPRMAILVGGGPAPGINGVISAATIEAHNNGIEVVGFYEGFKFLMEGDASKHAVLAIEDVSRIHFMGGSILRTSRANPTKKPESMQNVLRCLKEQNIRYVVTIGGDDTAYSSSQLAIASAGTLAVAHVPKTIDNDLPLPPSIPTFGFQTARHTGVQIVKNLMADAKTAPRWYIVVAMGRKAGHLALGIGKAAAAPLTLIPEEFAGRTVTFKEICDIVEGAIYKRQVYGRDHGVIILAEGLVEHMSPDERDEVFGNEDIERDEHGHIKLDDVEFGKAVRDELRRRFKSRGKKITVTNKNLGYELRCADQIQHDWQYTRDLSASVPSSS